MSSSHTQPNRDADAAEGRRSVDDIRTSGRATERELVWLCDLAKTLAACAMSTVAITPVEAERLLTGRPLLDSSHGETESETIS